MPEINNNPTPEIRIPNVRRHDKNIHEETKNVPSENNKPTNLGNDPKGVTGRLLVHRSKKKDEAAELQKRVNKYTREFLKDKDKAFFLMDSIDTFKDSGMSLEEATEATSRIANKLGSQKIDSIKDLEGIGEFCADLCVGMMKEFNWDIDKAIDATVNAVNKLSFQ